MLELRILLDMSSVVRASLIERREAQAAKAHQLDSSASGNGNGGTTIREEHQKVTAILSNFVYQCTVVELLC